MGSFWYQNASSPSGNGFTKPPDHKTAFYSMRNGHILTLQALVKENSVKKTSLSKSSKTEIKKVNIVAKRVAFLY
jgi:hypothetical protein